MTDKNSLENLAVFERQLPDLFTKVTSTKSRNTRFNTLAASMSSVGVLSCAMFEISRGYLPVEPLICELDTSRNDIGINSTSFYSSQRMANYDVLFQQLSLLPRWCDLVELRSTDGPSSRITNQMHKFFGIHEAIVTSQVSPRGTVMAMVFGSKKDVLNNFSNTAQNQIDALCMLVMNTSPTRRDSKNKDIWPRPGSQLHRTMLILANGGSDKDIANALDIQPGTASEYVSEIKKTISTKLLDDGVQLSGRAQMASILTQIGFGQDWPMYK